MLPPQSFLRRIILPRDLVLHLKRLAPLDNRRTRAALGFVPTPLAGTLDPVLASFARLTGGRAVKRA